MEQKDLLVQYMQRVKFQSTAFESTLMLYDIRVDE